MAVKSSSSPAILMIAPIIIVAALYFARDIFVPLSLAILLSFALGPLVIFLRRWHLGRVPSVVVTVLFAFLLIAGVGALIGSQLAQLAKELPQYQTNITQKIQSMRDIATRGGVVGRASEMLKELGDEIARSAAEVKGSNTRTATPNLQRGSEQQPVPVEIRQRDAAPLDIIRNIVGPLLQPLATAGIVIVFVIVFLLQREDLRDRFIRLAGSGDLRRTTEALDDAIGRLSRYLLTQTAINATFGLLIGIGLFFIGVPNPMLWGVFAMLLRFVPYIGAVIAATFPIALALAVDPGWSMLLWTAALFVVVEPITSQTIEPFLYGRSTGLSPVAVIVAAAFWTWLWGPVGLLLSTPLTLCLVVLGRHVARLNFLDIVLGDEPALTPEENFYQRLLANDPDEAAHQAEAFLKDKPLSAYYDEIAIRGLALAQIDANRGELDHERRVQIKDAVADVIDDLSDYVRVAERAAGEDRGDQAASDDSDRAPDPGEGVVLCVAGRGSLDEAAAAMFAQLLTREGLAARIVSNTAVSASNIFRLDVHGIRLVCLSYLDPGDFTNARYLIRRLRRTLRGVPIMVGFWTLNHDDSNRRDQALRATEADDIATSLREGTERVSAAVRASDQNDSAADSPTILAAG